jgi:hypothetical protein
MPYPIVEPRLALAPLHPAASAWMMWAGVYVTLAYACSGMLAYHLATRR